MSNSIEIHAIKVTQPYGEFFQTVMSAEDLLKCIYVNQAEMDDGKYQCRGKSLCQEP